MVPRNVQGSMTLPASSHLVGRDRGRFGGAVKQDDRIPRLVVFLLCRQLAKGQCAERQAQP